MKFKLGDTLIEVALAIGIFSMVAIAVVAVMSGSMSSAQSALELTLTREEIDAQAEALRFIQTSYIASGNTNLGNNTKYAKLWHEITDRAKEPTAAILQYHPTTCSELYKDNNLHKQGAFVINTRNLGYNIGNYSYVDSDLISINDIVIKPRQDSRGIFSTAATFPRLVFNGLVDDNSLLDRDSSSRLTAVEGIYVVPVRDNYTTTIVDGGEIDDAVSAYYDFYIRTCWFTTGATRPSTISTVIRLYNPDAIATDDFKDSVVLSFAPNDSDSVIKATGNMDSIPIQLGYTITLPGNEFTRTGFDFVGWSTKRNSTPEETEAGIASGAAGFYADGADFTAPSSSRSGRVTLYAIWRAKPFRIRFTFDPNGAKEVGDREPQKSDQIIDGVTVGSTVMIKSNNEIGEGDDVFAKDNYFFSGWEDKSTHEIYNTANAYAYTITKYGKEKIGDDGEPYIELVVNLSAVWKEPYARLIYVGTTIDPQECSSTRGCYITTQIPSEIGLTFVGWCSKKVTNYITCSGKTYQPGDYYPAISKDVKLYPTWKLEEFWVDTNIYYNCKFLMPGKEEFKVETFIDGELVGTSRDGEVFNGTKIVLNDHDFYQPVEFSRMVKIKFYDVEGHHIVNTDTICDGIPNCEAHKEDDATVVDFIVHGIPDGTKLNTTNQYAINIEPHWISDEPMELEEGVEACSDLEWEPLEPDMGD